MTKSRQATGRRGEKLAADRLLGLGWSIRATNWRCRFGELDIVAHDGKWLVIVEVRTRRVLGSPARRSTDPRQSSTTARNSDTRIISFGSPEESVDHRKRQRLRRLGSVYVQEIGWTGPWRIDVVAIVLDAERRVLRCDHYEHAVGAA